MANLYGYQIKVAFDSTKVTASEAAFDNNWFERQVDAAVPTGYNSDCSVAGTCCVRRIQG